MNNLVIQINKWNKIVHKSLISFIKRHQKYDVDIYMSPVDLAGACGLGSCILSTKLNSHNIKNHIILGEYDSYPGDHCWVESLGFIFDPTYKQIKFSTPTLCTPVENENYIPIKKVGLKKSIDEWVEWQGQNPNLYKWNWKNDDLVISLSREGKDYFQR